MFALLTTLLLLQEKPPPPIATTKEAMQKVQLIVGEWRGTALRGDERREGWLEKTSWEFKIDKDVYTLVLTKTDSPFLKEAALGFDLKGQVYVLEATFVGGGTKRYQGKLMEKERILSLEQVTDAWPKGRFVFSLLRDNRMLVDFEAQAMKGKDWLPIVQLGYTKEGVPFVRGEGIKCIVTGGSGTIPVTHAGKTYYVC